MKIRKGFVSNSSSSSFVLRKSSVTKAQLKEILDFFKKRKNYFNTELDKDIGKFITGNLEAHNVIMKWEDEDGSIKGWDDEETASILFDELIDGFGVSTKDYNNVYEDYPIIDGYERSPSLY